MDQFARCGGRPRSPPILWPDMSRIQERRERSMERFKDHFGLLVLVCMVDYALLVTVRTNQFVGIVEIVPIVLTVILTHRTAQISGVWRILGFVAATTGTVMAILESVRPTRDFVGLINLSFAVALAACIAVIFTRIISDREISVQTMYASLACYLMIGLIFAYFDTAVGSVVSDFFAQPGPHPEGDFAYFSFVTMTTVGYGDLTPGISIARSLAVLEAVIGQMVLVTLVARTVASLSGRARRDVESADD